MSQIDTYHHELCGELLGLPVYRVLEQVKDGEYSAPVGPDKLLIGGGGGEHSAAVIDVHRAVGSFLMTAIDAWITAAPPQAATFFMERIRRELVRSGALTEEQAAALDDNGLEELGCDVAEALRRAEDFVHTEFDHWGGSEWISIGKRLEQFTPQRPVGPHGPRFPEQWIRECIGEYVLVSYPEMIAEAAEAGGVTKALEAFRAVLAGAPLLLGVMAYPSGYDYIGGYRERLGDGNVRH